MADDPNNHQPVGPTRRIAGFVIMVIGVVLSARMAWLGAFYRGWFGDEEWTRFTFLLWGGAVLALLGYWLAYRSKAVGIGAMLAALAMFLTIIIHDYWFM